MTLAKTYLYSNWLKKMGTGFAYTKPLELAEMSPQSDRNSHKKCMTYKLNYNDLH